jgi:alkylation response protein AidB-like acyl-CoA dehydrogenase
MSHPTTQQSEAFPDTGLLPQEIRDWLAQKAAQVDGGEANPKEALGLLANYGLLGLGRPGDPSGSSITEMAAVLEEMAGICMCSAFATWAHRMVIEYVSHAPEQSEAHQALRSLLAGEVIGCTAMASAFQDYVGMAPLPVVAERVPGGLLLNGTIRWASNLQSGFLAVLGTRVQGDRGEESGGTKAIVALPPSSPGVQVKSPPKLLALDASTSSSFSLIDVFVPDGWVISWDFPGFMGSVRKPFTVLQVAFCLGLASASLQAADQKLRDSRVTQQVLSVAFSEDVRLLMRDLARLRATHRNAMQSSEVKPTELLRLRLEAAQLAQEATQLELKITGGAGYVAESPTARRLREAAFLPVQSPTEAQLRWELARAQEAPHEVALATQ